MKKDAFYDLVRALPKAEIHVHCEAVMGIAGVKKLFKNAHGFEIDSATLTKLFAFQNLSEFIDSFLQIQAMYRTPSDFDNLFADVADYLNENNIAYAEMFFSPSAFLKKGMDFGEIVAVLSKNIETIEAKTGRIIRILIDISRTFGAQNAMHNLELMEAHRSPYIIGIGLGGNEAKGPAVDYTEVYRIAREKGFHVVAHAGEDVGPESIWDTINYLKAERIGHGITAIQDQKLMDTLACNKIPLEICITSNIFTKKIVTEIKDHPVKAFYERGIPITINTDDPTFFKISLIDEYWNLYHHLHFSLEQIKDVVLCGINSSFMSADKKKQLCESVVAEWKKRIPAGTN